MSETDPAVSTKVASVSAYASITHCSSVNDASSELWIDGSATFTTVMSSSSMKIATQTETSVHHFRSMSGTIGARPASPQSVPTLARMQEVLDVSNEVAAELAGMAGSDDGVLDALRDRLQCTVRLRANQLTLAGDDAHVQAAREVIDELVELVEGGHQIGGHTVDAVLGALDADQDVRAACEGVVEGHRGKKI